jgi:hypothetical protein
MRNKLYKLIYSLLILDHIIRALDCIIDLMDGVIRTLLCSYSKWLTWEMSPISICKTKLCMQYIHFS